MHSSAQKYIWVLRDAVEARHDLLLEIADGKITVLPKRNTATSTTAEIFAWRSIIKTYMQSKETQTLADGKKRKTGHKWPSAGRCHDMFPDWVDYMELTSTGDGVELWDYVWNGSFSGALCLNPTATSSSSSSTKPQVQRSSDLASVSKQRTQRSNTEAWNEISNSIGADTDRHVSELNADVAKTSILIKDIPSDLGEQDGPHDTAMPVYSQQEWNREKAHEGTKYLSLTYTSPTTKSTWDRIAVQSSGSCGSGNSSYRGTTENVISSVSRISQAAKSGIGMVVLTSLPLRVAAEGGNATVCPGDDPSDPRCVTPLIYHIVETTITWGPPAAAAGAFLFWTYKHSRVNRDRTPAQCIRNTSLGGLVGAVAAEALCDPEAGANIGVATMAGSLGAQALLYHRVFLDRDFKLKWLVGTGIVSCGIAGALSSLSKGFLARDFLSLLPASLWFVLNVWYWCLPTVAAGLIVFQAQDV